VAGPVAEWPRWFGYAATLILEIGLTYFLVWLYPYFPLGDFPITYVVLIMLVAYVFGEGPAILALVTGLLLFDYYFVPPLYSIWPIAVKVHEWAKIAAFFMGTSVVGFATIMMRRSKRRIHVLVGELERQKALLEAFTHNVPVGLALHDRQTHYLIANEAMARLHNLTLDDIIGKTVSEIVPEPMATAKSTAIESVFATGQSVIQQAALEVGGQDRHFDIQHHPVRTASGEVLGVGAVVVETTELVQAHEALQRDYDHEHRIADILQGSMLAEVEKRIGQYEFETLYRAALDEARVGGDFYDVFELRDGKLAIVIGDVSGKGLRAAVQVAMARCNIRGRLYDCPDPSAALTQVNNTLVYEMLSEAFVTVFVGVLDTTSKTLTYANAGHEPAVFWCAGDRQANLLDPTGPLLGMLADSVFTAEMIAFSPGDEILLGTDGLFELRRDHGYMRIEDLIAIYTELKQAQGFSALKLVDEVIRFCGTELRDDIAVLRVGVAG
jgi:PAS domain S-box-containing protein